MGYPSLRAEAKQSRNLSAEALWIASSLALLAMTGDTHLHSRGMICPSFALAVTLDQRAQGMPGARRTHSVACKTK
jgi:hypothetical protein